MALIKKALLTFLFVGCTVTNNISIKYHKEKKNVTTKIDTTHVR
jgi:hypothetical protein